ncbi:unnamed protein product [Rhizoctonia solani]|uniref:DNA replication regulator SLD2 n=1 Tax=Rhizoctonia solani TaxID=456999 RepID=A0A8H2ZZ28_9AGAM|nr:unnamed protein product [Rhizoctonia solani]
MSTDIEKIKVEIKEWQRAYRRAHGRDPGKDELKKNPEMQAKYKIWQESLKAPKASEDPPRKQDDDASTPPRPSRSLVPKTMPVPSASKAPSTPFSARKKQAIRQASSSSDDRIPAPNLSSAKRGTSTQSSRLAPFNSSSRLHTGVFPSMLDSDSDDDNPFAKPDPASPTRSRHTSPNKPLGRASPSKPFDSPSKSNLLRTPSKPKPRSSSPTAQPFLTPRAKARKRMRGEEVPATPGDKRRKLGATRSILSVQDEQEEDDEYVAIDSPKKKRATTTNGKVFTGLFDDEGAGDSSIRGDEGAGADTTSFMDDLSSLRSTPPPPPSEPDQDWTSTRSQSDDDDEPAARPTIRPVLPALSKWSQDTWDAPAPGTDFSHLKKGFGKPRQEPIKQKAKDKKEKEKQVSQAVSNPFDLLPPLPPQDDEPKSNKSRYDNKSKGDGARSRGKKGKGKEAEMEMEDAESSDGGIDVNEIEWKPYGPLIGSQGQHLDSQTQPPFGSQSRPLGSQTLPNQPTDDDEEVEPDLASDLPSDLRTLLSLRPTRREFLRSDSLAKDVLAGRSTLGRGVEVWGVGDMENEEEGEGDDWDSEPEGWKGDVEM